MLVASLCELETHPGGAFQRKITLWINKLALGEVRGRCLKIFLEWLLGEICGLVAKSNNRTDRKILKDGATSL